jgi:GNAT superfamily N-acetyltransferase
MAASTDEDAIVRLLLKQLQDHGVNVPGDRLRQAVRRVLAAPSLGCFLLACHGDEVIGAAYVSLMWSMEHTGRCAWLEELYVSPPYRGHGTGRSLLRSALQKAVSLGCTAVDVEVDSNHARAESLYQREGFVSLSRNRWTKRLP